MNASSGDPGGHDGREPAYRYHAVLLLLLLLVVFEVLAPDDDWSRAVALALESAALLVAVATQRARSEIRRTRVGVISAGGALLVIAVASGVLSPALSSLLTGLVTAAIPLALVGGLLRLVRSQGVTVPAVSGALAVYLLLGLLFASAIGFVAHVSDTPYFANGTDGAWGDRVYYSFTVMTTTGFGDYTAAIPVGHALAVVEMLFGQIYLVTIIGILVGNLVRRQP